MPAPASAAVESMLSKLPWLCLPEINYSITSDPANARKRRWVSTKFISRAYQGAFCGWRVFKGGRNVKVQGSLFG
jgi:hypothetical protein